jgi:uncharacterized protein (DUF58 family)
MNNRPLLDQAFLEKLERLTLHWQRSFTGLVGGHNVSKFPGSGQEFLDHRHFHHGDDLRAVNWRAYLRLEKLFLKMFQVEPRTPVRLLLDSSDSMSTGTPSKFDYVRKLAASLSYVGLVRLDTMCLQPFRTALEDSFVCGGGRHRFMPAVSFLGQLQAGGPTNYLQVAREFAGNYPQRGLVIIISDFLDDENVIKPLQYLTEFGHELLLVHVWSPEDREPPWDGDLELTDAESGSTLDLPFDNAARVAYTAAFDAYVRDLQMFAGRTGSRYVGLSTETELEAAMFGPLIQAGAIQ